MYSNTLSVIRQHLLSSVGDLLKGQCGTTGATTSKIYAPFLWQANDYYSDHKYHAYVYLGKNIGVDKRAKGWALSSFLLEVHSAYDAACDATSYIELHRIFVVDELHSAINQAINAMGDKYVLPFTDETIVLVADIHEYSLPSDVTHITRITTEDSADSGTFENEDEIDFRDWRLISPRKLKLDENRYSITAGKDLRIEGYKTQATVSADTDVINIPPAWLVQKAITFLPMNKISSNNLLATYRAAFELSAREPRSHPAPQHRRVVE